jgi:GT2 family glycosyltransferase
MKPPAPHTSARFMADPPARPDLSIDQVAEYLKARLRRRSPSNSLCAVANAERAVSIVVPNWNGADLLAKNLPAVFAAVQSHPASAELIVVDDGSEDDSRAVISALGGIRLVTHERNRGFGAACMTGVLAARHELVLLLNSDARPDPGALAPLCRAFDVPDTFAASPLVLNEAGEVTGVTISVPYLRRGRIRYRGHAARSLADAAAGALPWYTLFPSGGAVVVHRERFLALGGFDPLFHPFYYEDTDLGICAWRRGWTCVVVPEGRVTHPDGGTIRRSFSRFRIAVVRKRNRVLFHTKNLTGSRDLAAHLAQQVRRSLARLVRLDPVELLGLCAALPRFPAALARRSAERAAVQRSEREIFALIEERWRANSAPRDAAS